MTRGRESRQSKGGEGMLHGFHAVEAALARGDRSVAHVLLARGRDDARARRIEELARSAGIPVRRVEPAVLDHSAGAGHQGIAASVGALAYAGAEDLLELAAAQPLFVAADGVQDPQNLGALLRVSAAAGVAGVFLPEHGSCGLTAAVSKAAAGTAGMVPVAQAGNLADFLLRAQERGLWVYGADAAGEPYDAIDWTGGVLLVVGGERGLRRLVRERCDRLAAIPMAARVESLNLATAAAVLLFEARRQRHGGKKNRENP